MLRVQFLQCKDIFVFLSLRDLRVVSQIITILFASCQQYEISRSHEKTLNHLQYYIYMTYFPAMSNKIYRCRFEETNPKFRLLSSIDATLQMINWWKMSLSSIKIMKISSFIQSILRETRRPYFLHKLHHYMVMLNVVVIDLNVTNSSFSDSLTVQNILKRSLHKIAVLST